MNDVRQAVRFILRNPGFAVAAALTLALGIGANSAMFTIVRDVLLRPLPYDEPDRLVKLWETFDGNRNVIAPANFLDWERRSRSFDAVAGFVPDAVTLTEVGEAQRVSSARVSPAFFDVLRVAPRAGRMFVADDERLKRAVVVVRESFARGVLGDGHVVGRMLRINGESFEVVGVAPDFVEQPSRETQIWRPLVIPEAQRVIRGAHYLQAIGRLAPGVSLAQAHDELRAIGEALSREHPQTNARVGAGVFDLHDEAVRGSRRALLIVFGATGVLLLLACVNVAHLLLARGSGRRTELAVRAALGASRRRLIRQLLAESVLLAIVGGAVGVLVAMWGVVALRTVVPDAFADLRRVSVDIPVLLFTFAASVFTALLFGAVPALQLSSVSLAHATRSNTSRTTGRTRTGRVLITLQVALALVLVVGSGLLLTSLARLRDVDPGFDTSNLVVARVSLSARDIPDEAAGRRFFRTVLDRLNGMPGVEAAAAATRIPLRAQSANMTFTVDTAPQRDMNGVIVQEMSPELDRALRLRLVRGRALTEEDAARVDTAVVSRTFARRAWGDADALGRRFRMGPTYIDEGHPWRTVVGVYDDVRQYGLGSTPAPQVYLPYGATGSWAPSELVVRAAAHPAVVVDLIRASVREVNPHVPVTSIYTMRDVMAQSIARPRFNALLLATFAAIALALAIVGIYGVIAYSVGQRTREIGVRVALGARRADVLRLIAGDGLTVTFAGIAIGLVAAALLAQLLEAMLFGVAPFDVRTYALASAVMVAVAMLACIVPAWRATRIDPAHVLKFE